MSIIVIDDEDYNLDILKRILIKNGFISVKCYNKAEDVLESFYDEPTDNVDLFLVDRNLPGLSGIEFTQRIRSNPKTCKLPVVMQTASSNLREVQEGIEAGVDYYVTKPFSSKDLIKTVNQALEQKKHKTSLPK